MHNSHLISAVSRDLALRQYMNQAQPATIAQRQNANLLFDYSTPITGQQLMHKAKIFGYDGEEDQKYTPEQRLASTISSIVPMKSTPIYQQNQALQSIMQTEETKPKESFEEAVTSSPNVLYEQQTAAPPVQQLMQTGPIAQPPPSTVAIQADSISIHKSTLAIIILIIVAVVIIELWLKQRRLEMMLLSQQLKQPGSTASTSIPYN